MFVGFSSYLPCVDFFSLPILPSPSLNIIYSTSIIFGGYLTKILFLVIVVQSLSPVWLFETPWTAEQQTSLSLTISQSLPNIMAIESMMLSNHLILCHPLLLLPSVFSSIRVFSNDLALHIGWPKYWSFSFSISPSNEYSRLISLGLTGLISLLSKRLSGGLSSITIQRHQVVGAQPSLWSNSHFCLWPLERLQLWLYGPLSAKWCLCFLITHLGYFQLHVQKLKLKFLAKEPLCLCFQGSHWFQSYIVSELLLLFHVSHLRISIVSPKLKHKFKHKFILLNILSSISGILL